MTESPSATITAPGITVTVGESPLPSGDKTTATLSSAMVDFESIKHLLSNKPVRPPNRCKPID
jgi:hypothetical protein